MRVSRLRLYGGALVVKEFGCPTCETVLLRRYVRSEVQTGEDVVVYPRRWALKKEGSKRITKFFATKDRAVREGRRTARTQGSTLIIHDEGGRFESIEHYGNTERRAARGV